MGIEMLVELPLPEIAGPDSSDSLGYFWKVILG